MKFMKLPLLILASATLMPAQSPLDTLVDRYFDDYFRLYPTAATAAGFHHPFDSQLEDYSRRGFEQRIELARRYVPQFEKAPASDDRDFMISRIRADLLSLIVEGVGLFGVIDQHGLLAH